MTLISGQRRMAILAPLLTALTLLVGAFGLVAHSRGVLSAGCGWVLVIGSLACVMLELLTSEMADEYLTAFATKELQLHERMIRRSRIETPGRCYRIFQMVRIELSKPAVVVGSVDWQIILAGQNARPMMLNVYDLTPKPSHRSIRHALPVIRGCAAGSVIVRERLAFQWIQWPFQD